MPTYRYRYTRRSIVEETFVVEAESEEQALDYLNGGCVDPCGDEWIDWYDDRYELEDATELDPLLVLVNEHRQELKQGETA